MPAAVDRGHGAPEALGWPYISLVVAASAAAPGFGALGPFSGPFLPCQHHLVHHHRGGDVDAATPGARVLTTVVSAKEGGAELRHLGRGAQ